MTQTQAPPEVRLEALRRGLAEREAPGEAAREDLMAGLTALAIFYKTSPGAELPDGRTLSTRVYGITYGDRVAELHRIAESWETGVETMRDGTKVARRTFGSVTLAAVLSPPDASFEDYLGRIAQRQDDGAEAAA
jgi:hypothetical protein